MTEMELNNYIKHYLEEDKTHTAIMLTGEWDQFLVEMAQELISSNIKSESVVYDSQPRIELLMVAQELLVRRCYIYGP